MYSRTPLGEDAYNPFGALASEDGPWANDTVSLSYNTAALRSQLSIAQPSGSWTQTYAYDASRRLSTTLASAISSTPFHYTYTGAGSLVSQVDLPNNARIVRQYDSLTRLTATTLRRQDLTELNGYGYPTFNARHQATRTTRTGGAYVDYTYDDDGQLQSATGREPNTTLRLQEQLTYSYDGAGNLNSRTQNALTETFIPDDRNQLTSVGRNSAFTVAGALSGSASSVTVRQGGGAALPVTPYSDKTYALGGFTLANGDNTFTVVAQSSEGVQRSASLTVNLPSTVTMTSDASGNLTSDGRRSFEYDDENQLTAVQVSQLWRTEYVYDALGRCSKRVERTSWSGGGFTVSTETRYLYDGRLVVQERDGNNLPVVTYTRGLDLSGSLQGAGGIGGLLARSDGYSAGTWGGHAYYFADGNGNVTALVNAQQVLVAKYLYDPFGNILGQWGPLADANVYRFSSKEYHANSGLYYYGMRFYDPNLQRWINRDPIGEAGGINLYGFVGNSPLNYVDPFGESLTACLADAGLNLALGSLPGIGFIPFDVKLFQSLEKKLKSGGGTGAGPAPSVPRAIGDATDFGPENDIGLAAKGITEAGKRRAEKNLGDFLNGYDRSADLLTRPGYANKTAKQQGKIMKGYLDKLNPLMRNVGRWSKAVKWIPGIGDAIGAGIDVYQCFKDN